jgi:hypothetical protein
MRRSTQRLVCSVLFTTLLLLVGGCHMDHRYVSPPDGPVWRLALAADTAPFFSGEGVTLFLIEAPIELPLRAPTDAQLAALSTPDARGLGPYPRRPWVERGDYEITLELVLTNLSDQRTNVAVVLNGINEFHEYVPGVNVIGDDVVIDAAGWERTYQLDPGERRTLTVREEELDEMAVDLATVVNGAPNSNEVVYFENQSGHDERSQAYIPPVVPALVGLRTGLRVQAGEDATSAPPAALEIAVRVRDVRDRLVGVGQASWTLPEPAQFVPVVPEQ